MSDSDRDLRIAGLMDEARAELKVRGSLDIASWQSRYPDLAGELPVLLQTLCDLDTAVDDWKEPTGDRGAGTLSESSAGAAQVSKELFDFLLPAQQPDEIGRLGPYRVLKVLGHGGMGVVFQAQDPRLGRSVALKAMLPEVAKKPGQKERFLREARAAAAIEHDHIIPIYQVDEDRGVPYIAMPFLQGSSLEDWLKKQAQRTTPASAVSGVSAESGQVRRAEGRQPPGGAPLKTAQILKLGREIAKGLAAAHARGMIHRDIKPANIWLDAGAGGRVKILDFGLARLSDTAGEQHLTQSGAILGTPSYMAPEQAKGLKVDARADLFSLGVVLYRLCTGRLPFQGTNTMSTLLAVTIEDPSPPRALNPDLPQGLSDLVMKLLEKDPAQRIASAQAVVATLQEMERAPASGARQPAGVSTEEETRSLTVGAPKVTPPPSHSVTVSPPHPLTSSPRRGLRGLTSPARLATAAAVLLLALLPLTYFFGGTIIRFATNQGELIVEVDDPNVEVIVKQDGVKIVDPTTKREFVVKAGDGEVVVQDKDGTELVAKEFKLRRGGKTIVTVTQGELAKAKDPDRRAGEYALSIGGVIRINGQEHDIHAAAELPKDPFRLTYVNFYGNRQVTDAGLAHFKDCKDLTSLVLYYTKVTDAGLAHFKDCKNLAVLSLYDTKVTDAGLADFKDCKNLGDLNLASTRVTDAGLAHFKDCKNLTILHLGGTRVTDASLAHLKNCKNLTFLSLSNTRVTDAGLAHFKDCKNLTQLNLGATQVTDAGLEHLKELKNLTELRLDNTKVTSSAIAELQKALPKCQITWSDPDRRAAEYALSIGGVIRINGQGQDLRAAAELPKEPFRLTYVDFYQNNQVTDAGLAHFKDCKNLTALILGNNQVTDAGLAHFKDCKNLTYLYLTGTQVTDAGLAHFQDCKNLTNLHLGGTRVTDAGLAHLKDCKNLTELALTGTQVTDAGLAHLKDCKSLTILAWSGTQVTDAGLAHFKHCKNLAHLNLNQTQVTDAGLAHFKDCKNLRALILAKTQVTDAGLAYFKDCKNLTDLNLGGTRVTDLSLPWIAAQQGGRFDLTNTRISRRGYEQLKAAHPTTNITWSERNHDLAQAVLKLGGKIEIAAPGEAAARSVKEADELIRDYFQVRRVSLAGIKQLPDLAFLDGVVGLEELLLADAGLNDASLGKLPKLPALKRLVLDGNDIRGAGLKHVANTQPQLEELSLNGPSIDAAAALQLPNLKALKRLSLVGAPLTDAGIQPLEGLTGLEQLDLRQTKVTKEGIARLQKALPKCQIAWDGAKEK